MCSICKILAQVLAQIRTRSGLENKNTNWFTSDSELKVGLPFQGGDSDVVSVSCFGVRVLVMFGFMFVHYTFSSVWVAEWPPFGK